MTIQHQIFGHQSLDLFQVMDFRSQKMFSYEGSQLISFVDLKVKLFKDRDVEFETCPIGKHHENDKFELKTQVVVS